MLHRESYSVLGVREATAVNIIYHFPEYYAQWIRRWWHGKSEVNLSLAAAIVYLARETPKLVIERNTVSLW
jgi:hypothetical protein